MVLPDKGILKSCFTRKSDVIGGARTLKLVDRCCWNVEVRLRLERLRIGDEEFNPEEVKHLGSRKRGDRAPA